jgi:antitoxin YefM
MTTVYHLNANELNSQFIESLEALFRDKEIEIVISEVDEQDRTLQPTRGRLRLVPTSSLTKLTGVVSLGGDALADSEALYDGTQ